MEIAKVVEHIGTIRELKRIAGAYVIDHKNLSDDKLKEALNKTAPQYYFQDNVRRALSECQLSPSRNVRVISFLILKNVVLQKDRFICPKRETEDEIISWEQAIVDRSNEELFKRDSDKSKNLELIKFVVETAWANNEEVSPDEKNLVEKLRIRLKITERELCIIEAKLGKFPKPGNQPHTRGEIDEVRMQLQAMGLLFALRDGDGTDFDVIPDELAATLRAEFDLEIRQHGYKQLLAHRFVRTKSHLTETLQKCDVAPEGSFTVEELQEMVLEHVKPSILIGGISARDGLPMETLAKWCDELDLNVSGAKAERIARIIGFYDNLLQRNEAVEDLREMWYQHFTEFASRNLEFLRSQQLIEKDNEVERKFEEATNYLFEKRFQLKPLAFVGSEHPDGALSHKDELIYWDNKSKESPVHLKDHLRQFDQYVKSAEKKVACFLVIGADFTPESSVLAMQYRVENGTTMTLITARELKSLAEEWASRDQKKTDNPFPLGYLIQPGRFNRDLVAAI